MFWKIYLLWIILLLWVSMLSEGMIPSSLMRSCVQHWSLRRWDCVASWCKLLAKQNDFVPAQGGRRWSRKTNTSTTCVFVWRPTLCHMTFLIFWFSTRRWYRKSSTSMTSAIALRPTLWPFARSFRLDKANVCSVAGVVAGIPGRSSERTSVPNHGPLPWNDGQRGISIPGRQILRWPDVGLLYDSLGAFDLWEHNAPSCFPLKEATSNIAIENIPSLKLTVHTWKLMVRRRSFHFGAWPIFRG